MPAILALATFVALSATACGEDTSTAATDHGSTSEPSESEVLPEATATLTSPSHGEHVAGGVDLAMSADGVTIAPAGEVSPGTGHFHVIADQGCRPEGSPISRDADHVHMGSGASTGTIYLEPGVHSLCLQVGDGAHVAYAVTDTVEVEVGVRDIDDWCAVVAETDSLFASMDSSTDPYEVEVITAENTRRLLAQLAAGLDVVDAAARDEVTELVAWGTVLAETFLAAGSEEAAAEMLWGPDSVLPTDEEMGEVGSAWVLDTCGVSID